MTRSNDSVVMVSLVHGCSLHHLSQLGECLCKPHLAWGVDGAGETLMGLDSILCRAGGSRWG